MTPLKLKLAFVLAFAPFASAQDTPPADAPLIIAEVGTPAAPSTAEAHAKSKARARVRLSQVKVASEYRYVTDGAPINRSLEETIRILREVRTDLISLGWGRIAPIPDKCSDLPPERRRLCETRGYSYEHMRNAVARLKTEMPQVLFGSGLSAEFLNPECWNELTGKTLSKDETWTMALDPRKWGLPMSKNEFQTKVAVSHSWAKKDQPYDPRKEMPFYFPDQTDPAYQELFLSWAKKQIDCGVDLILIDIDTKQARMLTAMTGDANHKAVEDSFKGAAKNVDEIHKYGFSKGKYTYVMSWATVTLLESPHRPHDLDAVMTTLSTKEISEMKIDETKWEAYIARIRKKLGDIPIFVMFDQGPDNRPLETFTQTLNKTQRQDLLRMADAFFQKRGVTFIYPIHGGMMAGEGRLKVRSYGKFNWYDSLAPEFETYGTIKELARKKTEGGKP
ncbi:MAG: hypothetical protein KKG09_00470 [Verrucomicrobia bacterium]|nr:hypothetical protein [Verrucomicrobiota bacterium]MBU4430279.1 hypothetical protein [Verrucomicrobiota bacterium]MBU4496465.1 hypothetical protein [Verrucomicrobiota bacterium]MCG2679677.1 hypothetical protein [Kiritimatiellia bacterium]